MFALEHDTRKRKLPELSDDIVRKIFERRNKELKYSYGKKKVNRFLRDLIFVHGSKRNRKGLYGFQDDSLLHVAVELGRIDVVSTLIDNGMVDSNRTNNVGNTALHHAVQNHHIRKQTNSNLDVDIVLLLIEKGADIHAKNESRKSPLHYAAMNENKKILRVLLDNDAKVDDTDEFGTTPLHFAARKGKVENVLLLIDNMADVNARDTRNHTPLHYAAEGGYIDIVRVLIENHSEMNVRSEFGKTALDLAIEMDQKDVIELLRGS